jgi:hypothetical protein
MNIHDAAYHAVHDYPGGSESLGPRAGILPAVLRNKVNPNNATHHLTLAEADRIVGITADHRMIRAWAHSHGFLLVRAPELGAYTSDMAVLEQIAAFMVASGEFGKEIHDALADGRITRDELVRIESAGRAAMTRIAEIRQRMEEMSEK